jgi:hypothetical protein
VSTLAGPGEVPRRATVEHGPEGDELVNPPRSFVDEDAHGGFVAQAGACPQRVGEVEIRRVLVTCEDGRHATLGPARRRLVELALRQHPDAHTGQLGEANGGREAGDAASDDENVEGAGHGEPTGEGRR